MQREGIGLAMGLLVHGTIPSATWILSCRFHTKLQLHVDLRSVIIYFHCPKQYQTMKSMLLRGGGGQSASLKTQSARLSLAPTGGADFFK